MSTPHDAIAVATTRSADLLRNFLILRVIYALENSEDPQDLEALDSGTGAIPQALSWQSAIWWLDSSDTTTAHDGITTLVTSDGYRYKATGVNVDIRSVISQTLGTPPDPDASPSAVDVGDAYLVPAGATGDWSSHADDIAIYTTRGWQFVPPTIGYWLHVQDDDQFVRYDTAGAWVLGQGGRTFDANSIPISALINGGRTTFIVQNQTTNAPPGSPVVPVAYIIGPSPTGAWAGKAAQVAVCEVDGEWTYYVPTNGYQAYDLSVSIPYRFNGSSWISAGGGLLGSAKTVTAGTGSTTNISTGTSPTVYAYSTSVAPTTSQRAIQDTASRSYTAKATGNLLRFYYDAELVSLIVKDLVNGTFVSANQPFVIALYRDAESNAVAWRQFGTIPPERLSAGGTHFIDAETWVLSSTLARSFWITASDASSHTYHIRIHPAYCNNAGGGGADQAFDVASLADRTLEVFEFTP